MTRSYAALHRTQHGHDLADNGLQVVDRADRLTPRPPEAPSAITGGSTENPLVQLPVVRVLDHEILTTSATFEAGGKLPFAQLVREPPQIFMLIVCGCHEPKKLGGRRH
jgi:hypothetical protein